MSKNHRGSFSTILLHVLPFGGISLSLEEIYDDIPNVQVYEIEESLHIANSNIIVAVFWFKTHIAH